MRANRDYLARAGRFLAADLGIRQFLDIGTGLPTAPNLHEVVQGVDPASRVVHVDNAPIVLVHARALLTSSSHGSTAYLEADLRDTAAVLSSPEARAFDFSRPIAISLTRSAACSAASTWSTRVSPWSAGGAPPAPPPTTSTSRCPGA